MVTLYQSEKLKTDKEVAKKTAKHEYFVGLLRNSADAVPENALIAAFLKDSASLAAVNEKLAGEKAKPTDKITFMVGDGLLVDDVRVHEWWRKYRTADTEDGAGEGKMRCLLTGEMVTPLETHPKIKGLGIVGGQSAGSVLIGFDKDAFCSYGLKQSANAVVSEAAAKVYQTALNDIVRKGKKLANTMILNWYKETVPDEDDPLPFLLAYEDDERTQEIAASQLIKRVLDSIHSGERADLANNRYYSMVVSGAGGRVMVREWLENDFVNVARNIGVWFDDLAIVSNDGSRTAKDPKLYSILFSLVTDSREVKQETKDSLVTILAAKLLRCAVNNEPIPATAIARAVLRIRADITDPDKPLSPARMSLIKAYHLRKNAKKGGEDLSERIAIELNPYFDNVPYQLGRLMAVLARLQRSALGDVGAGIVERFYAAASMTPNLVFGRLTRLSQFHLNKLEKPLAIWYENTIADIWSKVTGKIPNMLSVEEQSLFAMGYYQQIAYMRSGKAKEVTPSAEENRATDA
ncbi:MAG: type I-C CRISPR-associated protein Cas8c/Csd1 [bacterium]